MDSEKLPLLFGLLRLLMMSLPGLMASLIENSPLLFGPLRPLTMNLPGLVVMVCLLLVVTACPLVITMFRTLTTTSLPALPLTMHGLPLAIMILVVIISIIVKMTLLTIMMARFFITANPEQTPLTLTTPWKTHFLIVVDLILVAMGLILFWKHLLIAERGMKSSIPSSLNATTRRTPTIETQVRTMRRSFVVTQIHHLFCMKHPTMNIIRQFNPTSMNTPSILVVLLPNLYLYYLYHLTVVLRRTPLRILFHCAGVGCRLRIKISLSRLSSYR
jgi:hypothetical protein